MGLLDNPHVGRVLDYFMFVETGAGFNLTEGLKDDHLNIEETARVVGAPTPTDADLKNHDDEVIAFFSEARELGVVFSDSEGLYFLTESGRAMLFERDHEDDEPLMY